MDGVVADWRSERRDRLLDAASRVFARNGYQQTSMDGIAAEAGIGKPTIYRYFSGKAALFAAVFEDALDRLEDKLRHVLTREASVERRLDGMVRALIPTFRDHLVSLRVLSEDAAVVDQSKRRIFRDRRVRIAEHLARGLDHAGATADPLRTAHLVIGMIWSGTAGLRLTDEELAEEITRLVLGGISARRDPPHPAEPHPRTTLAAPHGADRARAS